MPSRFTDRIIQHLAHPGYEPSVAEAVARDMQVPPDASAEFNAAVDRLAEEHRLLRSSQGLLSLPRMEAEVVGRFRLHQRGFGFVMPEGRRYQEGDLFIPPGEVRDAVSGDRVRAAVVRDGGRRGRGGERRISGRVVEVLERGQEHYVGVLMRQGKQWLVQPDGRLLHDPVVIRDPHVKNAKEGDKVVIELLHYPEENYLPEGVIVRVLGEAGRPDVETQGVIAAHGLRTEFPPEALQEARSASGTFKSEADGPWPDREDLTGVFTITIDPPDARDFDDAITISHDSGSDVWTLGVHIADVASFVAAGGPLDQEAQARGNSVYLPRLVIPMLPEVLSNGVCSLQEGVPRFTRSAFITLDGRGNVKGQRLSTSVISSNKRLTYLEAQALIDGDLEEARRQARTDTPYSDELVEQLRLCDRLAKILRKRRLRDGMIVLNLPEVELVFDDDGHVVDALPEDNAFTHTIIEMFMVEANEAVARTFSVLNVPIIRRVHPQPVHGDLEELRMYARVAKYELPEAPSRHDLQRLLEKTGQTPAARAIHFAVLRTLTRAAYGPAMIGHYALASDHYAHFTSPIRRYADLLVHRAIAAYLDATDDPARMPSGAKRDKVARRIAQDERVVDEGRLVQLGIHLSETEREAAAAEEELRNYLVMDLLHRKHLGAEFTGVITGVAARGVFVSIDRFLVEGLVAMANLPQPGDRPDRWKVNEATGRLTAQRSGLSIGIGDIVTAQIAAVDVAARHLDLLITRLPAQHPVGAGPGPASPARRKDKGKGKGTAKRKAGKTRKRR